MAAKGGDPSEQFLAWQRAPGRSASGAIVGLVMAWFVGGYLVLGMAELPDGTAAVSGTEFLLWMAAPATAATAACTSRQVRYWAGAFVPGATVGWILGFLTFLLLGLFFVLLGLLGG